MFVMASATAIRPDAGALLVASGVRSLDWFRESILDDTSDAALAHLTTQAAQVPAGAGRTRRFDGARRAAQHRFHHHPPSVVVRDGFSFIAPTDADAGGTWIDEHNECEDISEAVCNDLDGDYDPCASACRHDEEVGGANGAARIAALLKEKGIQAAMTLDEGGFIAEDMIPGIESPVAMVNLAEKVTGLTLLYSLPENSRGILVGIQMDYHKKARGLLTAECFCNMPRTNQEQEIPVEASIRDEAGDVVATAVARWLIGPES